MRHTLTRRALTRDALTAALCAALVAAVPACAQESGAPRVRPSQHGTVTQRVGTTEIAIAYNRPVARGRALFGALVPWGEEWTPGADSATTISFSAPVRVNGERLAAGTYSLWAIPDTASWTIIFSGAQRVWHRPYPAGQDVLRVRARPATGEHMETLAFYFPVVGPDSTVLRLHWGTTVVPITIRTEATTR
jgi:hypothetical protein